MININIKKDDKNLSDCKIIFKKIKIGVFNSYIKNKLKFLKLCCHKNQDLLLYKFFHKN